MPIWDVKHRLKKEVVNRILNAHWTKRASKDSAEILAVAILAEGALNANRLTIDRSATVLEVSTVIQDWNVEKQIV